MQLSVDLIKDADLIRQKLSQLLPESAADVAALVRVTAQKYQTTGQVSTADVVTGLRQVATELEQQARTAAIPVVEQVEGQVTQAASGITQTFLETT